MAKARIGGKHSYKQSTDRNGRPLTHWQQLVKQYGLKGAQKRYRGRRQKDGVMKYNGDITALTNKSGRYRRPRGTGDHKKKGSSEPWEKFFR